MFRIQEKKHFWDVIEITKNPIIASHSNCYAINPHFRNLKDDQIKAIAKTGGVIMVNFLDDFINENGKSTRVANYNLKVQKMKLIRFTMSIKMIWLCLI